LQTRYAELVSDEMISGHPSAPLALKYGLRASDLTGLQLVRFFDAVRATDDEQQAVHQAIDADPDASLGTIWSSIR
jgi:hypothetical protein